MIPDGYFWDPDLKLGEETGALTKLVWPNYLIEASDISEPSLKFEITHEELIRRFPVWGIRRASDQKLVAYGHGILVAADLTQNQLPDSGWRFAMESVLAEPKPNCMCLLVANVDPAARGLGFSKVLVEKAKAVTLDLGFKEMIAPVRPTLKQDFPEQTLDEYIQKRDEKNEVFDPWLKLHVRLGGEVLNVCHESVIINATIKKWSQWLSAEFHQSGKYILPMGLAPLDINLEKNIGTYVEPNVWVRYLL